MWPSLETTPKTITVAVRRVVRCVELCPQALNRPDLHFESAGNVFITWIGREHVLYSGASSISFVEHCVTFRHDRRLLSLLGFVHNWPTSRWSSTKKENRFSLNGSGIMTLCHILPERRGWVNTIICFFLFLVLPKMYVSIV